MCQLQTDNDGAVIAKLDIGCAGCSYEPNIRISEKMACLQGTAILHVGRVMAGIFCHSLLLAEMCFYRLTEDFFLFLSFVALS